MKWQQAGKVKRNADKNWRSKKIKLNNYFKQRRNKKAKNHPKPKHKILIKVRKKQAMTDNTINL